MEDFGLLRGRKGETEREEEGKGREGGKEEGREGGMEGRREGWRDALPTANLYYIHTYQQKTINKKLHHCANKNYYHTSKKITTVPTKTITIPVKNYHCTNKNYYHTSKKITTVPTKTITIPVKKLSLYQQKLSPYQ